MSVWKLKLSLIYPKSNTAKSYNLWTAVKTNKIQIKFFFPPKREEPRYSHRQIKAKGSPAMQKSVSDSGSHSPLGSSSLSAIPSTHSCTQTQSGCTAHLLLSCMLTHDTGISKLHPRLHLHQWSLLTFLSTEPQLLSMTLLCLQNQYHFGNSDATRFSHQHKPQLCSPLDHSFFVLAEETLPGSFPHDADAFFIMVSSLVPDDQHQLSLQSSFTSVLLVYW